MTAKRRNSRFSSVGSRLFTWAARSFALGVTVSSALILAAPAQAAKQVTVKAGSTAKFAVVATGAERCTMTAKGGKRTVSTQGSRKLTFSFKTSKRARTGTHRVTVRCGARTTRITVRIRKGGTSRKLVASSIRVKRDQSRSTGSGSESLTEEQALAQAKREWDEYARADTIRNASNGTCIQWATTKRLDLVERMWVRGAANDLLERSPGAPSNWMAHNWDDSARGLGLDVGTAPQVGAIAVFEPGITGASDVGHVAFVEQVNPDGTFTVSEMNGAAGLGQVSFQTVAPQPGISFIY